METAKLKKARQCIRDLSKELHTGWLGVAPSHISAYLKISYDDACTLLLTLQAEAFIYTNGHGVQRQLKDGRMCATRFFMRKGREHDEE